MHRCHVGAVVGEMLFVSSIVLCICSSANYNSKNPTLKILNTCHFDLQARGRHNWPPAAVYDGNIVDMHGLIIILSFVGEVPNTLNTFREDCRPVLSAVYQTHIRGGLIRQRRSNTSSCFGSRPLDAWITTSAQSVCNLTVHDTCTMQPYKMDRVIEDCIIHRATKSRSM